MPKEWTAKAIKVGISIPEDLNDWVEAHAAQNNMALSRVYRLAIEDYYKKIHSAPSSSKSYEQLLEDAKQSILQEADKRYRKK